MVLSPLSLAFLLVPPSFLVAFSSKRNQGTIIEDRFSYPCWFHLNKGRFVPFSGIQRFQPGELDLPSFLSSIFLFVPLALADLFEPLQSSLIGHHGQ